MSGQWEVVGKKKDRGTKLPLLKPTDKKENKTKKNILNGVKIEEVLPKSQVQNLYASNKNKDVKKTQEIGNKPQESKKTEKKVNKPQEPQKPKPPKSIESGLNMINPEEFKLVFEKSKNLYPDAPIVWLKELVQFLNQKLPVDVQDPVFSSKPEGYPLNQVPPQIKSIIEKSIKEAGKNNAQMFFDIALTAMVTDMSKGFSGVGYKFYLQYIAINEPKLVSTNISKHITLRNSYQNRANIALSILWAVGHVGISDLHCGINVFQELMLPLIEMKNYSRFVVKYLLNLISRKHEASLSKEEYIIILDIIFSNKKNCPTDLQKELLLKAPSLQLMLFKNITKEKYHNCVDIFLINIAATDNKAYQKCLCDTLVKIFTKDQTTMTNWNNIYQKNVFSSSVLLNYINENLDDILKNIKRERVKELLNSLETQNDELSSKKRKEDALKDSIAAIKKIRGKMTSNKKRGSFFGSLLTLLLVTGSLAVVFETIYKVQQGRPEDSSFRKINNGIVSGLNWLDERFEENFPEYHRKIVEICKPYVILLRDLGKILLNTLVKIKDIIEAYVREKYPIMLQSVDKYAPGLIEQSQKTFGNVYSTSLFYYYRSVDYLQKEVFVGQLSPENMHKVVMEAFNATSQKATEYYHWLYEKVQTGIK